MEQVVTTKSGRIKGYMKNGLRKYLGIPYAQPPIGELRFKRSRPVIPWEGILDAEKYGPEAPQMNQGTYIGSEDCLTLNVVRPAEGTKLPVFVWIHGGGYMSGSACDPLYHGDNFANKGIVYVSLQYRLNTLGVFDFTTYRGCESFESNCALSDMILAIQWIHDNIEAFGGDAEHITIGGESAGGAAVVTLMAVPAVKGCFQQVIAESALCNCVMSKGMARRNIDLFLEGMGWKEEDLPKLLTMEPVEFFKGIDYVSQVHQYKNPGIFLPCPVIDDLLPERPIDAIRKGCAEGVQLIIGSNLHEGTMFVHPENTGFPNSWEMVREMFEKNGHEEAYEKIFNYYANQDPEEKFGSAFVHFATDYAFEMPSIKVAGLQSKVSKVWMYRFELLTKRAKENGMLVSHAFELPCVFGAKDHVFSKMIFEGESDKSQNRIIEDMNNAWVNFIKNGNPGAEQWPEFHDTASQIRIFDWETHTADSDRSKMMDLWKDLRFYEE